MDLPQSWFLNKPLLSLLIWVSYFYLWGDATTRASGMCMFWPQQTQQIGVVVWWRFMIFNVPVVWIKPKALEPQPKSWRYSHNPMSHPWCSDTDLMNLISWYYALVWWIIWLYNGPVFFSVTSNIKLANNLSGHRWWTLRNAKTTLQK